MLNLIIASTYLQKGMMMMMMLLMMVMMMMMTTMMITVRMMMMIMMMVIMMMMIMMMMIMNMDHESWILDHGSHIHLHIESPPIWHFRNTQPLRNSGADQRQGCTDVQYVLHMFASNLLLNGASPILRHN